MYNTGDRFASGFEDVHIQRHRRRSRHKRCSIVEFLRSDAECRASVSGSTTSSSSTTTSTTSTTSIISATTSTTGSSLRTFEVMPNVAQVQPEITAIKASTNHTLSGRMFAREPSTSATTNVAMYLQRWRQRDKREHEHEHEDSTWTSSSSNTYIEMPRLDMYAEDVSA